MTKNKKEDFQQLHTIFLATDFLLLPTRAECAGVVFSEASAYGIPSITTDTGGVNTYVRNDINGFTFPLAAKAEVYAEKIGQLLADKPAFQRLKLSARKYYDETLNWDVWGRQFQQIAKRIVKGKR